MKNVWLAVFGISNLFVGVGATAQDANRDLATLVGDAFQRVRDGTEEVVVPVSALAQNPQDTLRLLRPYEGDTLARVRHLAYTYAWQVGCATEGIGIRREVTARLARACMDPDPLVWQHAAGHLLCFEEADFSSAVREVIHALLNEQPPKREIVRIVGVAGMREEVPRLETHLIDESKYETGAQSGRWYGTVSWAARLVRARFGVQEDVQRVVRLVEDEPDMVVRVTVLLADLGFTRQPAAFDAICRYLDSEDRLPAVKDTAPGTEYAQYAIDILARNLRGFPVPKAIIGAYRREQILQAREWTKTRPWRSGS